MVEGVVLNMLEKAPNGAQSDFLSRKSVPIARWRRGAALVAGTKRLVQTFHSDQSMHLPGDTRAATVSRRVYRFGPFIVDEERRTVRAADGRIELPPRVFDLLCVLLAEPARVFRREELMVLVWPDATEVGDGALSQAIAVLRRSLGKAGEGSIRTVARVGYGIAEEVDVALLSVAPALVAPTADPPAAPPAPFLPPNPSVATADDSQTAQASTGGRRAGRMQAVLLSIGMLVGASILSLWHFRHPGSETPGIHLELSVLDNARKGEVLRDGLGTLIGSRIVLGGRIPAGAEPRIRLSGQIFDVPGEPRRFRLRWILDRDGQQTGHWVQIVDGARLLEAIDALAMALSDRGVRASGPGAGAIDEEALAAFADGLMAQRDGSVAEARGHFERALAESANFGLARAQLARMLELQGHRDLAVANAKLALDDLAPASIAHLSARQALQRMLLDHVGAGRTLQMLIEAQPAEVEWRLLLARMQLAQFQLADAQSTLDRFDPAALAPRWRSEWHRVSGSVAFYAGRQAVALAHLRAASALATEIARPDLEASAQMWLATVLWGGGDHAAAREAAQTAERSARIAGDLQSAFNAKAWRLTTAATLPVDATDDEFAALRTEAETFGNRDASFRASYAWIGRLVGTERFREALNLHLELLRDLESEGADGTRRETARSASAVALLAGTANEIEQLHLLAIGTTDSFAGTAWQRTALLAEHASARGDLAVAKAAFDSAAGDGSSNDNRRLFHCRAARMAALSGDVAAAETSVERCRTAIDAAAAGLRPGAAARLHAATALLRLLRSDPEGARREIDHGRSAAKALWGLDAGWAWFELAETGAFAARPGSALASVDEMLGTAALRHAPRLRERAEVARCVAALRDGDRGLCKGDYMAMAWRPTGTSSPGGRSVAEPFPDAGDAVAWLALHRAAVRWLDR